MTPMTQEPIYQPETHVGKVQWFDKAKGYGYITPGTKCDCPCHDGFEGITFSRCIHCHTKHEADVFVHFSAIEMAGYRALLTGEVVEFEIVPASRKDKRVQANNVRVIR